MTSLHTSHTLLLPQRLDITNLGSSKLLRNEHEISSRSYNAEFLFQIG